MDNLPSNLIDAVREQRAILFLGAGASWGATHPTSLKIPTGEQLRDLICDRFLQGRLKERSLAAVAEFAANERDLRTVQQYIRDLFEPFGPAEFHKILPTFNWRAIISTNYDKVIEKAYDYDGAQQDLVKFVKNGTDFDQQVRSVTNPLPFLKIHGCIDYYSDDAVPLVLGTEQYTKYEKNRTRLYDFIRGWGYEYPIIFVGYKIEDSHIQKILFDLTDGSIVRPQFFTISPNFDEMEIRYWASKRVTCVPTTFQRFLEQLDADIPPHARKIDQSIGGGNLSVRKHYRIANVQESRVLSTFLDKDVLHVRENMGGEVQVPQQFYKGYDTGWGCIFQNLDARRSVTDTVIIDAVLNDDGRKNVELFVLKGPGGNGKTVCLKRAAWEAATQYEKLCLYHHNGGALRYEAIEELSRLTGKRIYLFIDRVALVREELRNLLRQCESTGISITILAAERDSEWQVHCAPLEKFLIAEFPVRYLSEREIDELLVLLERHSALGLLNELNPAQRRQAFLERAQRQLLVALHEATLGKPFEIIIQEEYAAIEPEEARTLYLDICAMHQFGVRVRAGLVSRVSGIPFEDFKKNFIGPLSDIVFVEEDKYLNDLYYTTRHQHIAEMIFHFCLPEQNDKFEHLSRVMDYMNPDFSSDAEVFQRIIRGHNVKNLFSNVELGRLIYDKAEKIAVDDSFVLQQRAIFEMNHSNGSLNFAENSILRAMELNPNSNIISHTAAEIARRQASNTSDPLKKSALRRQAYERLDTRAKLSGSEYVYHTLSLLALEELKEALGGSSYSDVQFDRTVTDAVKKVERAIQAGLQADPDNASLLSTESQLRDLLEQSEVALKALDKAFERNPHQDWLAVRLAQRYSAKGDVSSEIAILKKCLDVNPSSKSAHLAYGKALAKQDSKNPLIIDHFRRGFTVGDDRYDAQFWYARELFIRGLHSEAREVFRLIHERAPRDFRFRPSSIIEEYGHPKEFSGKLERKEDGYCRVRMDNIEEWLFCLRSETDGADWQSLVPGRDVNFEIGFSRRGPVGVNLRPKAK